jgi:acyl carrier protein
MDDEVYRAVRQLAAESFEVPESLIESTTSPNTLAEWDSLQHLNLMMAIEDMFAIEVDPEDLPGMTDIGSIVDYVEARARSRPYNA